MSLKIAGALFAGPFPFEKTAIRKNQNPAVFAIVSREGEPWNPVFRLIDVGESGAGGVSFAEHPSVARWKELATGEVGVYLLQRPRSEIPDDKRQALVEEIRDSYDPPNGTVAIHGG